MKDIMEDTLEARWCVDSETGLEVLLDLKTGDMLARKDKNGTIICEQ